MKNRDVQVMLEALVEVWTEELVSSGRIEIEGLFVIVTQVVDRGEQSGHLQSGKAPRHIRQVVVRVSRGLRQRLTLRSDEFTTHPFRVTTHDITQHLSRTDLKSAGQ